MTSYCPSCHAEFEEGISRCTQCEAELRSGPAPSDDVASGWVVVRTLGTDEEAALIAGFLESEGISSTIESGSVHAIPETVGDLSGVHVLVRDEKRVAADRLLVERDSIFASSRADEESILTDDGVAHLEDTDELAD